MAATANFTVQVTGGNGLASTKALSLTINAQTIAPVTLTLYVHNGSVSGPVLSGALVTGSDGAGQSFNQTTGTGGYVTITGTPGTWQFTASDVGYTSTSWSQSITATGQKDAFLTPSTSALILGADFNTKSGAVSWSLEVSGRTFAYIKASQDNHLNRLPSNMSSQPIGFTVGMLHYADPDDYLNPATGIVETIDPTDSAAVTVDANSEADFFYQVANPYLTTSYLLPVLDLEDEGGGGGFPATWTTTMTGWQAMANWVNAWTAQFQKHMPGVYPILYMTQSYAGHLAPLLDQSKYKLWICIAGGSTQYSQPVIPPIGDSFWTPAIWPWVIEQYQTTNTVYPPDLDVINPSITLGSLEFGGTAAGVLSVSTSSLALPATTQGSAGATTSFTVGGSGLGSGDSVTLTAPAGSEISQNSSSGFSITLQLQPDVSGNLSSATVFARISASATGNVSGSLTVSDALNSSLNKSISVSGSVLSTTIISVAPSPASGTSSTVGQSLPVSVSVGASIATAGVLQVTIFDNGALRQDWIYVAGPQSVSPTFNPPALSSEPAGAHQYNIEARFRPGATSGPFANSSNGDVVNTVSYTVNWQNPADTAPPTPNPSTWATLPFATGTTSISMTATTASDPSGVLYFFHNLTITGHDSGWQASPSYTDTGLSPSTTYVYQVVTRDQASAQNQGLYSASSSATTQPLPDTTGPALSITTPLNGATVTSPSLPVSGTASDINLGNNGILSVTVNGITASGGTISGSGTANWSTAITLVSGSNTITVVATDGAGNPTPQTITVTYTPPDTKGPSLSITGPANGSTFNSPLVAIDGTASDSGLGDNGIIQVTVNGVIAQNDTASGSGTAGWTEGVKLLQGANTITVVAYDGKGNATTQTITLNYTPTVQTGSLQVSITPATAVSAGAQWQVDGGPSRQNQATVPGLPVGNHTVTFTPVNGYITPASQIVLVNANATSQAQGTYAPTALNTWISRSSGTTNNLSAIAVGNGTIVAVGSNGTIVTSTNGITWVSQTSGTSLDFHSIAYGNGIFVAGESNGRVDTSPDGIHWSDQTTSDGGNIYGLTYGNGLFVALGLGAIIQTSPDGIAWTPHGPNGGSNLYGATWGNGLFVVGGYKIGGLIVTSPDGNTWAQTDVALVVKGLAYGNGKYVAAGDNGAIETSPDGTNWTVQNSGTTVSLEGITYNNGFVAVGLGGTILSSTDGVTWTNNTSGTVNNLNGAGYGSSAFFVVGNSGTILQSNIVSSLALYWDANTSAGLANGSGIWDTSVTAKWSTSTAGSNPLVTWAADANAFFQTAGTLTATLSSAATINLSSLTQASAGTALTVAGGTLQIDTNAGIVDAAGTNHSIIINSPVVLNSANITIDSETSAGSVQFNGVVSEIGGSRALTKIGTGTVQLAGANTFTGGVTLKANGPVAFSTNTSFGTGPITFNAGTSLTSTAQIYTANTSNAGALANNIVVTPGSFGAYTGNHTMILSGSLLNPGGGNGTFLISPGTSAVSVTLSGDNHVYAGTVVYNDNSTTALLLGSTSSGSANSIWMLTGVKTQGIAANVAGSNTFLLGELASASGIGRIFNNQASGTATFQVGDATTNTPSFGGIIADGTAGGNVGLTKTGTDNQVFTGNNTYTGPTSISGGRLTVNGSLAAGSTVTVNSRATLAGSGKINGAANLASGGIVSPGSSGVGTLTFTGGFNLNGGCVLNFDFATTTTSDKIALTGAYVAPASGTVAVNINALSGFGVGTYSLITGATGISAASFTLGTTPSGHTYQLSAIGTTLSVIVGNAPAAPTGLAALATNAQIDLTWSASAGATSYTLLRGTANGGPYPTIMPGITATSYHDIGLTNGTTYYYVVTATNTGGTSSYSNQASATPTTTIIDSYWSDNDIGAVGQVGNSSYSGGTFTLNGSGTGVSGAADSLDYTYQALVGDGAIIARVATGSGASGVMMRETLDSGARVVDVLLPSGVGAVFQDRVTTGGSAVSGATTASIAVPYWVKLARAGNIFTGYTSPDGVTWTQVGTTVDTMATSIYVGLAQSSLTNSVLAGATFSNVSIVPAAAWASQDIGTVPIVSASNYSNGVATVQGTGASLYNGSDQFRYTYQAVSGDCDITARIASQTNTNASAKAGVMIRAGLTATSAHALVYVTPSTGLAFEWRLTTGGNAANTPLATGLKAPYWVRLVRSGNLFTAYRSPDGTTWTTIGSETISMPTAVYIGLPVCSYNTSTPCTATFDNITIDP